MLEKELSVSFSWSKTLAPVLSPRRGKGQEPPICLHFLYGDLEDTRKPILFREKIWTLGNKLNPSSLALRHVQRRVGTTKIMSWHFCMKSRDLGATKIVSSVQVVSSICGFQVERPVLKMIQFPGVQLQFMGGRRLISVNPPSWFKKAREEWGVE